MDRLKRIINPKVTNTILKDEKTLFHTANNNILLYFLTHRHQSTPSSSSNTGDITFVPTLKSLLYRVSAGNYRQKYIPTITQ